MDQPVNGGQLEKSPEKKSEKPEKLEENRKK